MARIAKMRRQFNKQQFGKMTGGGLVSDRETQQHGDKAREAAQAVTGAQTAAVNRAAAGAGSAPILAGALRSTAGNIAREGSNAAVRATGQASMLKEQLGQARKAAVTQAADTQVDWNREQLGKVLDAVAVGGEMLRQVGGNT